MVSPDHNLTLSANPVEFSKSKSEKPIFIFGCPRSGTSLLSRILNYHPNIAIPYESHVYNTFYPWSQYYGDLRGIDNRKCLVKDILSTKVMQDWSPRPDIYKVLENVETEDFHGVFEALMRTWAMTQGKLRWGEKTPAHIYYWQEILSGFPDLQIIHILRDGRDVALSWKNSRFGPKHVYPIAKKWVQYLEMLERVKTSFNEETFLEIRYEDLVTNPEQLIQQICSFLGEEFSPELLNFYKGDSFYPTDQQNQKNLSKPLLTENIEKWRSKMSLHQLRIFEAVAGETLERYGYGRQLPKPGISQLEKMWISYIEHPPKKIVSMLKNYKGQMDGLQRLKIYLRLRLGLQG